MKEDHLEALIAAVEWYNAGHATEDEDSDIDLAEEGVEHFEFSKEENSVIYHISELYGK